MNKHILALILAFLPITTIAQSGDVFILKDLGNGFTVSQNLEKTELIYKKKALITYQHFEFNLNPNLGGYEYACPETGKVASMGKRQNDDTYNSLLYVERYDDCRREYLRDRMKIMSTLNPRFYILSYGEYEASILHIIDTKTKNISKELYELDLRNIQIDSTNKGILFTFETLRGDCNKSLYFLNRRNNFIEQENVCLEDDTMYSMIRKTRIIGADKLSIEYDTYSKGTNLYTGTIERIVPLKIQ